MITIGNQYGGPELNGTSVYTALNRTAKIAINLRDQHFNDGESAWINPIFIVPGSVLSPDFEGQKLGHFSRKQKGLVVMIAVPKAVADGDGIVEFILEQLRSAVKRSTAFFSSKGISFPSERAESLISEIGKKLVSADAL